MFAAVSYFFHDTCLMQTDATQGYDITTREGWE